MTDNDKELAAVVVNLLIIPQDYTTEIESLEHILRASGSNTVNAKENIIALQRGFESLRMIFQSMSLANDFKPMAYNKYVVLLIALLTKNMMVNIREQRAQGKMSDAVTNNLFEVIDKMMKQTHKLCMFKPEHN